MNQSGEKKDRESDIEKVQRSTMAPSRASSSVEKSDET